MSIFLAAAAVGTGLSMWSTLEEGKEIAEQSKIAQMQLEEEAKAARATGRYESREKRKEGIRAQAKQIAQMVAQGGKLTGSNVELLAENAANYEADARTIMFNYLVESDRLRTQGAWIRYQGQVARRAARIRAFTGLFGNISQILAYQNLTSQGSSNVKSSSYSQFAGPYKYSRNFPSSYYKTPQPLY
jgi:hypothetical protein